jgi:hypothetical protein
MRMPSLLATRSAKPLWTSLANNLMEFVDMWGVECVEYVGWTEELEKMGAITMCG